MALCEPGFLFLAGEDYGYGESLWYFFYAEVALALGGVNGDGRFTAAATNCTCAV